MNIRQAKKLLSYPIDAYLPPNQSSPYSLVQWARAHKVYKRALKRCPTRGFDAKVKWSSVNPHVKARYWRPGLTGYGALKAADV